MPGQNASFKAPILLRLCFLLIAAVFLAIGLAGLPDSPFSIISSIRKQPVRQISLLLPSDKLSASLAVNACSDQSVAAQFTTPSNYNVAKSGLNVFKSRLAKEYKVNSGSFHNLVSKVLSGTQSVGAQSKTCLLPLKISTDSGLGLDIPNSSLLEISLGEQSVFCSKGIAYLMEDSKFYPVNKSLANYAKNIKDRKIVAELKRRLQSMLSKKADLAAGKKTEKTQLEQNIRKLDISLSYAQYFLKESDLLGEFFDSLCHEAALIATPNAKAPLPSPVSTKIPGQTLAVPTAITVPTIQLTPAAGSAFKLNDRIQLKNTANIRSEGRIAAETFLGQQQTEAVGTIIEGPTVSVDTYGTILWFKVNFDSGIDGWCADDNFRLFNNTITPTPTPVVTGTTPPISEFNIGDRIIANVYDSANVRIDAGLSMTLLGTQPKESTGTIIAGPKKADNYTWWHVNFDSGVDGWSGEDNFTVLESCNNGQSQSRTRYKNFQVPAGQNCQAETQTRTCANNEWGSWSGTFTNATCSEQAASPCSSGSASSITQFGITWTFDRAYTCGQFVNGDFWVLGPVKITQISPDYSSGHNGWMVNINRQDVQSFDNRYYAFSPPPALPYTAAVNSSVVKVQSVPVVSGGWSDCQAYTKICTLNASVLTVVDAAPAADAFRPPYQGNTKEYFYARNLQTNLLLNLAPTQSAPSLASMASRNWMTRLDFSSSAIEELWFMPFNSLNPLGRNWGGDMAKGNTSDIYWLSLNYPLQDKLSTLYGIVQEGIDLYGARKYLGTTWQMGGGGNGAGRMPVIVFAAMMLNSSAMRTELLNHTVVDQEVGNTFWESEMFKTSRNNQAVLWGMYNLWPSGGNIYYNYWKALENEGIDRTARDPYNYIDGVATYQILTALPAKYEALLFHLYPQMRNYWPETDIKILRYADRWVNTGRWEQPDPCAPYNGNPADYGIKYGPNSSRPGECILDADLTPGSTFTSFSCQTGKACGRFPHGHGSFKNSSGVGGAERRNAFGEEMWNAYRYR